MNKNVKVGLLSLIAIMHVSTIIGGFFAYRQMYETIWQSQVAHKKLVEKTEGIIIDMASWRVSHLASQKC